MKNANPISKSILDSRRSILIVSKLNTYLLWAYFVSRDVYKRQPLEESEKELWHAGRLINEALGIAMDKVPGPVHINIPLEEPLHELQEVELPEVKIIRLTETKRVMPESETGKLLEIFNQSERVLILAGQNRPDFQLERVLRLRCV